jgi:hypothetical protein
MIPLGFELGTGAPIAIPRGHLAITGQSQASGKTTTLEGLVSRAGCRAIAFVTKRGEGSFRVASPIPPYFKDRTDWPFVRTILEATAGEKLKFERAQIINVCQDYEGPEGKWQAPKSLADVLRNAERALFTPDPNWKPKAPPLSVACPKCGADVDRECKMELHSSHAIHRERRALISGSEAAPLIPNKHCRGFVRNVYTVLVEYLREVVPEIDRLPYTKTLELAGGLNVMDLTAYTFPLQALVVRSVIEFVGSRAQSTITVIPEAWKFAPKMRNSPVRMAAEELIRQGAALRNFLWCDSQDLAGISSVLLRQVTVWLFGVQRDPREIERTLEHIPADQAKPNKRDIATLGRGEFIVSFERQLYRVYVQPAWMSGAHAEAIARGEESVESAREIVRDFDLEHGEVQP